MTGWRGPFDIDQDQALGVIREIWGDEYDAGFADGAYRAARLDGTGDVLTGETPDELAAAIGADWNARRAR